MNSGELPAAVTRIVCADPRWIPVAEDNWFWLEPGQTRRVSVRPVPALAASSLEMVQPEDFDPRQLCVGAWNADLVPLNS